MVVHCVCVVCVRAACIFVLSCVHIGLTVGACVKVQRQEWEGLKAKGGWPVHRCVVCMTG
jgi:hypothetical protein